MNGSSNGHSTSGVHSTSEGANQMNGGSTTLLPQIQEALHSLRITRRLQLQETDIAALTQTIHNIALFADHLRNKLVELDVNPLLLDASGNVIAVDAYLRIRD